MYYMKQDAYKNISYGLDSKKTIETNGDAIISLAMIAKYIGKDEATVEELASWAGNNTILKIKGHNLQLFQLSQINIILRLKELRQTN